MHDCSEVMGIVKVDPYTVDKTVATAFVGKAKSLASFSTLFLLNLLKGSRLLS